MAKNGLQGYLLRMTEEQAHALKWEAHKECVTVRALLLHRTLGIPLEDVDTKRLRPPAGYSGEPELPLAM